MESLQYMSLLAFMAPVMIESLMCCF